MEDTKGVQMKILLKISKILIVLNIVGLILCNVGVPLTITFTTNDKSASLEFFFEIFCEFAPMALFWLSLLFLLLAIKSYASFKLGLISREEMKKLLTAYLIAEIVSIIAISLIISFVLDSNHQSLTQI
jgi:hypothetical protein